MSVPHFDVTVVGTGLVGSSLALALSSLPLSIAVIEAKNFSDLSNNAPGKPLALNFGSSKILNNLGLWTQIEKFTSPIQTVHISDRGHFGMTRIRACDERIPALGYVIPANYLNDILQRAVLNLSLIHPATVTHCEPNQVGWTLRYKKLDQTEQLTTSLLIAADGTDSTIKKLTGINSTETSYDQSAVTSVLSLNRDHQQIAYERFLPGGALAFLPLANQQVGCVWTTTHENAEKLLSLSDENFLQTLQEQFGFRLGRFISVSKRSRYPLKMVRANQITKPGLVLIGNAAQTLHPIAAQGFNLGLKDVSTLAEIIKNALRADQKLSNPEILKLYEQDRKQRVEWTVNFTHSLTRLFNVDFLPLTFARNANLLALDFIPFLKRRVIKHLIE